MIGSLPTSDETCSANSPITIDLPDTYELLECLGKGGFGVVVKCQKVDTGQIVAIKFPLGQEDDNEVGFFCDFGYYVEIQGFVCTL
uniref:Protein kinase domain-containing protein n=1 Tax=Sparus aurata TaxID=8175 RepID=A0A671W374_SPAAU